MKKKFALLFIVTIILTIACSRPSTPMPTLTPTPSPTPSTIPPPTLEPTSTPIPNPPPMTEPQPGAEGIGDPYFPSYGNGGYDVQHYTLEISIDPEANTIEGIATIEALTTQNLSSFNFDFIGLDVSLIEVDGQSADYTHTGRELTIMPSSPLPPETLITVEIAYSGTPAEDPPPGMRDFELGWHSYSDGIFVAGEPAGASTWFPANDHPLDKAAYTFEITVPKPYIAAANGLLVEEIDHGETTTYIFESSAPIANYLVTIGVGEFEIETQEGPDGLLIRNYFEKDIESATRRKFDITGEMIETFSQLFGPYPFDAYGVIVHDLSLGFALETQTLTVFGSSFVNEDVIAHELAHQWFGDSVTLTKWQDIWLNEGFASFSSDLWMEHAQGEETALDLITRRYREQAAGSRIFTIPKEDLLSYFANRAPSSSTISKEDLTQVLSILFDKVISLEDIENVVAGITTQSISYSAFQDLLDQLEYEQIYVPAADWNQVLDLVGLSNYRVAIPRQVLPGDPSPDSLFHWDVYSRGALTLHALRARLGDETFFEVLQTYQARFQYGNATTQDFIAVAEEVSGQYLEEFFTTWLYDQVVPDIPELELFREDF